MLCSGTLYGALHVQSEALQRLSRLEGGHNVYKVIFEGGIMSEQKQKKRYVGRTEYVVNVGKKSGLEAIKTLFTLLAIITFTIAFFILLLPSFREEASLFIGASVLLFSLTGFLCVWLARKSHKLMAKIDLGTPINRRTVADLPEDESLVRASQEPEQLQQAVLLRAAQGNDTPSDELLRPAETDEKPNIRQYEPTPAEVVNVAVRGE